MDDEIKKEMDFCHSWVLPKGTLIHFNDIPYELESDTVILGNTVPMENFIPPTEEDIRKFLESD